MAKDLVKKYGKWAAVTGAAQGIGRAFAEEIASRRMHVLLIDILDAGPVAAEIAKRFSVETAAIQADLGESSQVARVLQESKAYEVGLFCCNHASTHMFPDGKLRRFLDIPEAALESMLQVNVASCVRLIYGFAQRMQERKRGGILITSSGEALVGGPYLVHYAASKAFLAMLGDGLWWELQRDGIDVTTVFPAAVNTQAATRFLTDEGRKNVPLMAPEQVARSALEALGKKMRVTPGIQNKIQSFLFSRIFSRRCTVRMLAKFMPRFFSVLEK